MSRRRRSRASSQLAAPRFSTASLLLLGLILGLAGALYYTWVAAPTIYVDASPARLGDQHKAEYIFLVSQSYAVDGDWEQAQKRLAALDDPALTQTVTTLLENYVREQRPSNFIRNLALLARQLGSDVPAVALFAPTPLANVTTTPTIAPTATAVATNTPTATPPPTFTPRPTFTPAPTRRVEPTAQPTYRLLNQQRVCPVGASSQQIEVVILDALLDPLPGVETLITWDGGADHFFTGFKPEQGAGYGDFAMSPDVSYSVVLADGSPEISGLRIEPCDSGLDGGWRLTFQNLVLQP